MSPKKNNNTKKKRKTSPLSFIHTPLRNFGNASQFAKSEPTQNNKFKKQNLPKNKNYPTREILPKALEEDEIITSDEENSDEWCPSPPSTADLSFLPTPASLRNQFLEQSQAPQTPLAASRTHSLFFHFSISPLLSFSYFIHQRKITSPLFHSFIQSANCSIPVFSVPFAK